MLCHGTENRIAFLAPARIPVDEHFVQEDGQTLLFRIQMIYDGEPDGEVNLVKGAPVRIPLKSRIQSTANRALSTSTAQGDVTRNSTARFHATERAVFASTRLLGGLYEKRGAGRWPDRITKGIKKIAE